MRSKRLGVAIAVLTLVALWGTVDSAPVDAVVSTVQTAKLFVGAVGTSTPVYRYEVGATGAPILDLTLTDPTFALPGWFAFNPAGQLFVVNHFGGVSRFLDPQGTPVFNGSINSPNFGNPGWATFRDGELFVADSAPPGNVLRFVFDSAGNAVPNGLIPNTVAGVIEVDPDTGELFIPRRNPDRIERYLIDASGNAVSNGSFTGPGLIAPHDMAFSPWGELFVVNGFGNGVSRFVFDSAGNATANGLISEPTLNIPLGADFSPWGELFVSNRNDGLIHRWVFDASFDASFNASFNGSFQHVAGIHDLQFAPVVVGVDIDIKPGSDPNSINVGSNGKVAVAILSSAEFDATTVDPLTVTLASSAVELKGNGTPMASFSDVDGDGRTDIIVHVATDSLMLSEGDTEAVLEGQTFAGVAFSGSDTVRIVP